ncbi:B3 domain-containing protein LOC_Os12g40080 [Quercus suber]|uniref:B3 domain-containing protein LOC_Os12g40080 n=1 Tax=Quercus suber TaxID=58331 RepID=UPI000CE1B4C1|nr:B3 domain-containing protein LOC_Os12g40080-like [Quercus suber]
MAIKPECYKSNKPSFFKVLIGDFSEQLRIPPAFVKNFNGRLLSKCSLRSSTGKVYIVRVEKRGNNGLFFWSGWHDFVKDNSLDIGDFLVFKYDGNSTMFKVKIYGRNTCEKDVRLAKREEEYPIPFMKKGKQIQENAIIEELKPDCYKESFGQKAINSNRIISGCSKSGEELINDDIEELGMKSISSFKSQNSYFIATWTWYSQYYMTIPKFVAIEKDLISKKRVMLLDPTGSPWPIRLDLVADGFLNMTNGWPDFCRGNKIGAGDTFIFEFVTQTVMQVHIFRAGAKKEAQCLGVDKKIECTEIG